MTHRAGSHAELPMNNPCRRRSLPPWGVHPMQGFRYRPATRESHRTPRGQPSVNASNHPRQGYILGKGNGWAGSKMSPGHPGKVFWPGARRIIVGGKRQGVLVKASVPVRASHKRRHPRPRPVRQPQADGARRGPETIEGWSRLAVCGELDQANDVVIAARQVINALKVARRFVGREAKGRSWAPASRTAIRAQGMRGQPSSSALYLAGNCHTQSGLSNSTEPSSRMEVWPPSSFSFQPTE
jgi:hypothetical protein